MAWGSKRSLTGGWDTVLRVGVSSSNDDVLPLLLNASWVACGWNNVRDVGAGNVVSDEVGDGRKRRGRDGEELANIYIIDEAEEEGLATGIGSALSQAKGCSSCEGNY